MSMLRAAVAAPRPVQDAVVIFDEGHNVEGVCEDNASAELSTTDIAMAVGELTQLLVRASGASGSAAEPEGRGAGPRLIAGGDAGGKVDVSDIALLKVRAVGSLQCRSMQRSMACRACWARRLSC